MKPLRRFFTRLFNTTARRLDEERLQDEIEEHLAWQTGREYSRGHGRH